VRRCGEVRCLSLYCCCKWPFLKRARRRCRVPRIEIVARHVGQG
jgi:hypothetical protein